MKKYIKFITIILVFSLCLSLSMTTSVYADSDTSNKFPDIFAKSAITIDAQTGEIIYCKNIDSKIYPASTTKLLTAILLTESKKENSLLTYTKSASMQPSYSMNINIHPIKVGDQMTADSAMKGLLIYSGNDAAYVIADNILGKLDETPAQTIANFSKLMNKKVKELGLKNTNFVTPNGLHDPNHYSTAYDMSVIGRKAFSIPWILKTVGLTNTTAETVSGVKLPVSNRNKIIFENQPVYDKTCLGGKTGFTDQAGKCLVAIYNRNGKKIIGVVMKSVYDQADTQVFKDMNAIINWSYNQPETTLHKSGTIYKTVPVRYKPLRFFGPTRTADIPVMIKENIMYYKNSVNDSEKTFSENVSSLNPWKLNTKDSIGTLTLKERNVTKSYKLYSTVGASNLLSQNKTLYMIVGIIALVVITFVVTSILLIVRLLRNGNNSKKIYR